ncbi:HXXEE domain-containing protein [Mycobacterium hubeiense]|uniref:HXXEE domain-containing protein n=1 Tax=Mycobacterium hubeiense TaxID=1867256 RepID=UPI000C7F6B99|nr:HXXEE domain-containing protein [Mycobacterium sp. QGD 101]
MSDSTVATSGEHADPLAAMKMSVLLFVPFVVFVLHTLEELPQFAAWVSKHFSPLTTDKFAVTHIPLILVVLLCSWQAARPHARVGWVIMVVAFQWQFAVNAVFHLGAAAWFGDYSPGMVTAATVSLPATVFFFAWLRRERILTANQVATAVAVGTAIAAAAIGVLFTG